jgi:crotonobetainyl-CoA:carnitine CoA-transferase CaiB-like acyl-CoA transferase
MKKPAPQIYSGLRVLDLGNRYDGTTIAGAYMGDFGADVIKIDSPLDDQPARGGIYVKNDVYLPYKVQGRNKRHITLDISKPRGRELFHRLVAKSDVVIETYRPGVMEGWGHSWETLSKLNPRLIFCRISPFGQSGPYAGRCLDGRSAEAFGGFCCLDGERNGPPIHSQMDMGGEVAGAWAIMGINLALYWRDARGGNKGQVIDIGLYEPIFRQIQSNITPYTSTGKADKRYGNRRDNATPWLDSHETKDGGHYSYSSATPATCRDTLLSMGFNSDPRFKDINSAFTNREEFHQEAAKWMKERTLAEVEEAFFAFEGPGSPCNSAEDLCKDPHILARELIVTVDDPELGKVRMQGVVPKFSKVPGKVRHAGERPGARNQEVYSELLGLKAADLKELRNQGII